MGRHCKLPEGATIGIEFLDPVASWHSIVQTVVGLEELSNAVLVAKNPRADSLEHHQPLIQLVEANATSGLAQHKTKNRLVLDLDLPDHL